MILQFQGQGSEKSIYKIVEILYPQKLVTLATVIAWNYIKALYLETLMWL